jgi:hypothetical protein
MPSGVNIMEPTPHNLAVTFLRQQYNFDANIAEGMITAVEMFKVDISHLATKEELKAAFLELKGDIKDIKSELKGEIKDIKWWIVVSFLASQIAPHVGTFALTIAKSLGKS